MAAIKKVISIRNFKGFHVKDENFEQLQWITLENAIQAILRNEKPLESFEDLYRIVENLQTCSYSKISLLDNLIIILETDLQKKIEYLLIHEATLFSINKLWCEFCSQIRTLKNVFLYFDRSAKKGKYKSIEFMSFNLFKKLAVLNPDVKNILLDNLLATIENERNGGVVDRVLIKNLLLMLSELQVYEEVFEGEFVKNTENYYKIEGDKLINEFECTGYLKHISERVEEEIERGENYLVKHTASVVLETVYKFLIKLHLTEILNKGFEKLIESNCIEDLKLMYNLLNQVHNGTKNLMDYFTTYVTKQGLTIVNDTENEKNIIQNLIDYKDKLDNIIEKSFCKNDNFYQLLRNTFVKFINYKQNKPAQLLAKYIDSKLRCKDISDEQLETVLDKVMVLFRFIQGKDIFEAFYKRDLAKRLLLGKSTSQDAEDSMITKLKLECGSAFTSKIEGMFNDINISQSINNSFKQYLTHLKNFEDINRNSLDLCINVLTSSYWPNYPSFEVNLPAELANYQVTFQKFYSASHNGRKLFWQPNLGHCVIKAVFETGNKELQVSLFQTLVLLLFNNSCKMTYKEIHESTNLEICELKRTLLSLACGKSRVLLKQSKGKDVEDEDIFVCNTKFSDKLFRVRINQIQLKETVEEEQATEKSVLIDRQFQIDAAIVRIMKNKKMINHNALISELFNVLDIPVKPSDLKKRIELLIEREYMERDKDNSSTYVYVA